MCVPHDFNVGCPVIRGSVVKFGAIRDAPLVDKPLCRMPIYNLNVLYVMQVHPLQRGHAKSELDDGKVDLVSDAILR